MSSGSGRSRLFSRRWLVAAVILAGGSTLVSAVLHGSARGRESAALIARAAAEEVAAAATANLELLALEAFAPASPWSPAAAARDRVAPATLLRQQSAGDVGRCRDILPAAAFFRVDLPDDRFVIAEATAPPPAVPLPSAAALSTIGRRAGERSAGGGRPPSRVALGADLGPYAVVSTVLYDQRGKAAAVYGMVVNAEALAATIFGARPERTVVPLDRFSVVVTAPDGSILFGTGAADRDIRATVRPAGALERLSVIVALGAEQLPATARMGIDSTTLALLGMFAGVAIMAIVVSLRPRRDGGGAGTSDAPPP